MDIMLDILIFIYRDFIDAITQLEPVQIQNNPLLQIQLVKASSELGHYSVLIKVVALQIILVDLGVKLKSRECCSQVNLFFFILIHFIPIFLSFMIVISYTL